MRLKTLCLALWIFSSIVHGAPPQVAVTIKPIHSLVASLMQGVATPVLLLPDSASPHTYQLKPSTLKQLQQSDIVIWVGPELELFMSKALTQIADSHLITLKNSPGLTLYPLRENQDWQSHTHDHTHAHAHDAPSDIDPHFWLSPHNAIIISTYLANYLATHDPLHAPNYAANLKKLQHELIVLDTTLQNKLKNLENSPFLVYHDGYQYFEKAYHLNGVGTVITNPHLPLSAKRLRTITDTIRQKKVRCLFRETEFSESLIEKNLKIMNVTVRELDPLGTHFPAGPKNYRQTLEALGDTFRSCLILK